MYIARLSYFPFQDYFMFTELTVIFDIQINVFSKTPALSFSIWNFTHTLIIFIFVSIEFFN